MIIWSRRDDASTQIAPLRRSLILALLAGLLVSAVLAASAKAVNRKDATGGSPTLVVNDLSPQGPINRSLLGTNESVYAQNLVVDPTTRTYWPTVASAAQTLNVNFVRMSPAVNFQYCAASDCTYHWWKATPGTGHSDGGVASYQLSPDSWMHDVVAVAGPSAEPMPVVNLEGGTVNEAQDWVAYMNGAASGPSSLTILGDGTTVGHWAQIRVANGQVAPYHIHYWEIGNEEFYLHACSGGQFATGCVHSLTPACALLSGWSLYGCLVGDYGRAMHLADPSVGIVVGYDGGTNYGPVATFASSQVAAIDTHHYEALVDPYGTTFDTDGQTASYTITDTTTPASSQVTVGLWMNAIKLSHVNAYLDGSPTVSASFTVSASGSAQAYTFQHKEPGFGTFTHTLTVVACDNSSVIAMVCLTEGHHPDVYLHHITTTIGSVNPSQLANNVGCMDGVVGLQTIGNGNTPTTLQDTRVPVTTGATGSVGVPGTPWRVAADSDFPTTFTAGQLNMFAGSPPGGRNQLTVWRSNLAAVGFGHTPLIVGEYAGFGGCEEEPADLTLDQSSALWSAMSTVSILNDRSATQPIVGAAAFSLHGGGPPGCFDFSMVTTVLTSRYPCGGGDTAYVQPVGLAMQQFSTLSGTAYPVTIGGVPSVHSYPTFYFPAETAAPVSATSSINGSTLTIVIVNSCPAGTPTSPSQCASPTLPLQVSLGSGKPVVGGSATTVAAAPYDNNTDTSQTTVTSQPVAVSVSGGSASINVPPFSITTVTLSI